MEAEIAQFLGLMEAGDLAEFYGNMRQQITADTALHVSLLFGFFVVAHFVGSSLSKVQAGVLSILYSVVLVGGCIGLFRDIRHLAMIVTAMSGTEPDLGGPYLLPLALGTAWIFSLVYLFQQQSVEKRA